MPNKTLSPTLETYLSVTLPQILEENHIPGAAVALVKDGKIICSRGIGVRDINSQIPVDENTIFAIGSTSKAFTAVVLGTLVDEGKLDWDDLVRDYIPEFRMNDPVATAQMNIRDIQCHRGGLGRHDFAWFLTRDSRRELLNKIQHLDSFAPFRSRFYYNNWMWLVAGIIAERITGKTWEENIQQRIFEPLGMKDANCSVEDTKTFSNYSLPHQFQGDRNVIIPLHDISAMGPAGSINANISDLARWLSMNVNMGCFEEKQVISQPTLDEIFSPQMAVDKNNMAVQGFACFKEFSNIDYTLGWFCQHYRGYKMLQHGGGIDGFSSFISVLPDEGLGAAVLTNLDGTSIHYGITWDLIDRLLDQEPINWTGRIAAREKENQQKMQEQGKAFLAARKTDTYPSHPLQDYCGEYSHPGYARISLRLENEQLYGTYAHIPVKLEHFQYDTFMMQFEIPYPQINIPVSFSSSLMGKIESLSSPMEEKIEPIRFNRT